MPHGVIATRAEITHFPLSPSVEQARQLIPPAEARLAQRKHVVLKPFMIVQGLVCGYFLIKWVAQGHYIGGPIFAGLLWCVTWVFSLPLGLFWRKESRELKRVQDNVGVVLHRVCTDFLAEQTLGPYRWISRGENMLGLFPETAMLYLYSAESGHQHALIDAPQVVRQVRVDEKTQTVHTSNTHTTHSERKVSSTHFGGEIGKGTSNSTTYTSSTTHHTFTLQIQFQIGSGTPCWTTWSFGDDWQDAENWRLQIAQAAGL
ncbi:hypothetical protein E3Z27_16105 [Pseudomonas mediterranea]|uniref:Uncharacterized protein n=1 Tax=Pseudomonas mediterranea TaxID=183795 RepID=A0AAX2DCJ7_9PSED|nr:hypothetical protein [Pseudomonas mediterranea]KGU86317.1 hypothetical protein N005_09755 [Pseudomonas mediterranea CFBP 5447]MBL0845919.1 hypothetical protein [Pseudomonas mediterranea]QHA83087.1 hypothetical protein E3Z27_16105 [Pseudomonas mediterranea]UZD98908.1 hypothetical protein LOY71_15285 [Pseudomonas mediterranea]CAH0191304.1 hypothetical protein SRABI112_01654 [Pseudomonas mediterranea]